MKYFNHILSQEISEDSLNKIVEYYRSGQAEKAKDIISSLGMEEFVFGLSRSDFLYYLPVDKKSKILDVGCGLGTHSFNIAGFAGEVYGCDVSKKNIDFCESRRKDDDVKNIHFLNKSIRELVFPPNTFDSILIHGDIEKNLQYAHTLLKPDGVLYFGIENTFWSVFWKKKYERMLNCAGFNKTPDFYIAYPCYHIPRFLIPLQDTVALRFILNSMTAYKGVLGVLIRLFVKISLFTRVSKVFFHSHAVFIKK